MKILITITLLLFLQNSFAQKNALEKSKDDNTLLWQISGKGIKQPSFMFGTFHLLCKDDIVFSKNLQTALSSSSEVYFEINLDDTKNTFGAMQFMNMKNKTLKELYTTSEYEKVTKFFKDSLKMGLDFFAKTKPMMLEALLFPKMMPCKSPSGIELELLKIAKAQKKPINGFETIEFQAAIFDSISYESQAKSLLRDIDSTASFKIYFNKMVDVYKRQQTDKLVEIMADTSFNEGENNDALLKNRNTNWVNQLQEILKTKNIFMAVGAAHLFGKDGLIAMLRKKGYTVIPIKNRE